ncbi:MAG: putative lipid II flippase FtsW [Candidatus Loosdrechtia sp.]|uniref:FtsW/RodA/SpoVE family cell cycle protein n=1 Tax=Candidatus Loosdrechtia sp. TaxID=3101272 RepID=UPI003A6DBD0C|nr:MAG: putative lipid II flippase FtsW [Candidatus Jettenia sp. AMX2]
MKPWHLIVYSVVALLGFSVVTVMSTDKMTFGTSGSSYQFTKHLLWIGIGAVVLAIMTRIDYHYLQKLSIPILIISFILLLLVLVPGIGTLANGARRWIRFGSLLGIQPSEFTKLALIIFLANYVSKNYNRMSEFVYGFFIPFAVVILSAGLIILQPDFGTAAFMFMISLIILIVAGTRIIFISFIAMASVPFIHKMLFEVSYRKDRLLSFMDPWKDPSGTGYQIIQSWIALGSGGLTGLGIGGSRQKLFFLPESSSDFIFTIIGEELGFLGVVGVITLFILLLWQGLRIVHTANDIFGFFLGLGITIMFGLQAIINIAAVSGIIPTKGIPLPFISSGGSSLLFSMIGVGILVNIAQQSVNGKYSNTSVDTTEIVKPDTISSLLPVRIWRKIVSGIANFSW